MQLERKKTFFNLPLGGQVIDFQHTKHLIDLGQNSEGEEGMCFCGKKFKEGSGTFAFVKCW